MELKLQLILTASCVNFVLTYVKSEILYQVEVTTTVYQAVPSQGTGEGGVRENLKNLFNSIANNNTGRSDIYRENLKQEAAREQQAFDEMKDEIQVTQNRNANKKRNFYKKKNDDENLVAVKRDTTEDKNDTADAIRQNWEKAHTLIKNAGTEPQVLSATVDFKDTFPKDVMLMRRRKDDIGEFQARFTMPNNMYSDLALFLCALKLIRICIDDAYTTEIRPKAAFVPPSSNLEAQVEDWRDYFMKHQEPGGFAGRVREAYEFFKVLDDKYAAEFARSAVQTADLCRRYESKIPQLQSTYESYLQREGKKIVLSNLLKNDTHWNMNNDDLYTVHRIRHAMNRTIITWVALDESVSPKTVIPLCANYQLFSYRSMYTTRAA